MKIIKSEQVIFTDIDDTIVMHDTDKYSNLPMSRIVDPYCGTKRVLALHAPHIRLLKERAKRGAYIIAMSAGGHGWVEAVINSVGLAGAVSLGISKPIAIIDDLPIEGALGHTMYLNPESKWKR